MIDDRRETATTLGAVGGWCAVAAIFAADCLTQLNVSILYALPLVVLGQALCTRRRLALTAGLIAAAVIGYVIKTSVVLAGSVPPPLISYRLLNRSLVAAILVLTALALRSQQHSAGAAKPRDDFEQLVESFAPIVMTLLAVVVAAAILAADLIAPGQYNLPILYGLPIVLVAAARSERLIWGSALILAVLSMAGYFAGPAPQVAPGFQTWTLVNRVLAVIAVIGLAALLRSRRLHRTDLA